MLMLDFRYIVLTLLQALYAYFVEGDIIFVGKRKTFDKRVSVAYPFDLSHSFSDFPHRRLSQSG
jgi:hypothetical protein